MQVEYDTEADAMYVRLREARGATYTRPMADGLRFLHYDPDGALVGVEFIEVEASGVNLEGLPESAAIADALRALRVA